MALTVDILYQFTLKLIKKSSAGGLTDIEWAHYFNAEQSSYMEDLLGRFQARSNGKAGANTGLIENETIIQKLSPFIKKATLTITNGAAAKPVDFVYRLALRKDNLALVKLTHSQREEATNSVIDAPNPNSRIFFIEYGTGYELIPATATGITLDYVSEPADVKWGYTLDGNGRKVYDSATSVHPLWKNGDCREITKRILKTLGVSFKDGDFAQFGESVIQKGN